MGLIFLHFENWVCVYFTLTFFSLGASVIHTVSPLYMNFQVENFQWYEHGFSCPSMYIHLHACHTLSCEVGPACPIANDPSTLPSPTSFSSSSK